SWPALKSSARSECVLTLDAVTAPFLSWRLPTLFAGSLIAAYELPPRAMKSAAYATTLRRMWRRTEDGMSASSFRVWATLDRMGAAGLAQTACHHSYRAVPRR